MLITPDYSQASEQLSPGKHRLEIVSFDMKTSKKNEKYLSWKMEASPGGLCVYYITMIEGKGAGMLRSFIKAVLGDHYADGPFEPHDMLGKSILANLQYEKSEYNGQTKEYLRVKGIEQLTVANEPHFNEQDIPF